MRQKLFRCFFGRVWSFRTYKKSAPTHMYVKSYASFLDFYLLKLAILPSFVIYRGSLSRIYLSATLCVVVLVTKRESRENILLLFMAWFLKQCGRSVVQCGRSVVQCGAVWSQCGAVWCSVVFRVARQIQSCNIGQTESKTTTVW